MADPYWRYGGPAERGTFLSRNPNLLFGCREQEESKTAKSCCMLHLSSVRCYLNP